MSHQAKALLVNAITFARVPLVLAWAGLAVWGTLGFAAASSRAAAVSVAACAAMLLSGLSDLFDGQLARKWGVVSTLGKMADPLMDKVFYIIAFPVLLWEIMAQGASAGGMPHALMMLVFAVVYFLRDTWVTFLRGVGAVYGADVSAMWLGKVRTALSFPCAGWVYVFLAFNAFLPAAWHRPWLVSCYVFEMLMLLLTVVSAVTYTRAYLPCLRRAVRG